MDIATIRKKYFPFTTENGYRIEVSTSDELYKKTPELFKLVFPDQGEHPRLKLSPERRKEMDPLFNRYHVLHHEWFLIHAPDGTVVGWHMGEAEDYATFYMRNTGIHPAHQNRGVYTAFNERLGAYLEELDYERISSHHMVTNRKMLILKLRLGFVFSALELTEQWGPLAKVVKLLKTDRKESFHRQYGQLDHL